MGTHSLACEVIASFERALRKYLHSFVQIMAPVMDQQKVSDLRVLADKLRIDSILSTNASKSGHPSSCASMAEIMSVLFYREMKYKLSEPRDKSSDRFIDVATGSLGQGLGVAAGMAYVGKYFDKASYRTYCLIGDGVVVVVVVVVV